MSFILNLSRSHSNANVWRGIPDDLQRVLPFPHPTVHLALIHLLKWALLSWKRPAALQAGLNWRVQNAVSEKPSTIMRIPAYTNANIHRANQLCPRTALPLKFEQHQEFKCTLRGIWFKGKCIFFFSLVVKWNFKNYSIFYCLGRIMATTRCKLKFWFLNTMHHTMHLKEWQIFSSDIVSYSRE